MAILYYYHDPMCSWCWGFRPTAEKLFAQLPRGITRVNILGGLAADSDLPMPADVQSAIHGHWRRIEAQLGTRFNHDFWTVCKPRRSTYPACRAVIAAGRQDREEAMIAAIQHAYYLRAMNPSDVDTLVLLAEELELDSQRFADELLDERTERDLQQQIEFARHSPIKGFPSLALELGNRLIPIQIDYVDSGTMLEQLQGRLLAANHH
jgi:putative protein-disulfide isomerase